MTVKSALVIVIMILLIIVIVVRLIYVIAMIAKSVKVNKLKLLAHTRAHQMHLAINVNKIYK